jgi:hypothetical protein
VFDAAWNGCHEGLANGKAAGRSLADLLLDPTQATQPESPRECVQKGRSIGILVAGVTTAIALGVGLIFLFTPNYGNKLTFRKGE